jgi:LacI family transcriptional regulator
LKKTTIKDIASKLNVSASTISRALSDHPDISEGLKNTIKETARSMKYRPSTAALHLKKGTNKTIALILPEVTAFFYPSVINGIEEVLHKQGFTLLILTTDDSLEREVENIDIAYDNNVAGVLIALSKETLNLDHLKTLDESNIPVILVDKVIEGSEYSSVTIDDFRVSYQMVQHLYKSGSRNIVGVFGKTALTITHQRFNGFSQALKDLGLRNSESHIQFVNNSKEAKEKTILLLKAHKPDGLYLMTDEIMLGALPAISQLGIRVPEQMGVIAISDGILPHFMVPKVSHMKHDGFELGSLSTQKLIQYINAKNNNILWQNVEKVVMNTNIVLLESTK